MQRLPVLVRIVRFARRDDGPTAVEYAVMLALIIVGCISVVMTLGKNASSVFSNVYASKGDSGGGFAVGDTSPGYTKVPTGQVWGLSLPGGGNISYNSTTGIETATGIPGYPATVDVGAGELSSDRGHLWTRLQ